MGPKCDICGKSSLRRHTHVLGDLSRTGAEQRYIEDMRAFAQMRGESFGAYSIPGGSISDINNTLRHQVAQGNKEAREFRKRVSRELDQQRKRGQKPNRDEAVRVAQQEAKKKPWWK